IEALKDEGLKVAAVSRLRRSAPIGPSRRCYANAAVMVETNCTPDDLLAVLKRIERCFGRRVGGQRWTSRVLDLDIVLWSGGAWASKGLTIPHVAFRDRDFVLAPLVDIAPQWRDPVTGLTPRHLLHRLRRPAPRP
ncbi:MAG: 2-amino-4-hydroxy-6-hydroxymethyldihydropteridine diphosphokinase, partial [Novosphingobium sp.]